MLELRLLGHFTIAQDGRPIEIQLRRSQSLLAYLALSAGTAHRREKLAGLFWPDADESSARSNLRHSLWRIRKALEPTDPSYLIVDDLRVQFNAAADYWLDTAEVERKVDDETPIEELIAAVSVYSSELLPGFYDEWVSHERERLAAVFEHKMQMLLNRLIAAARWNEILEWGERWIALGTTPEPAYRALMIAHGGLDNLSEVAQVYKRCLQTLEQELGVLPSEQTRLVYERLIHGEKPAVLAAATTFEERYQLGDVIGRGGMGIVYRARDTLLARDVAVKILRPGRLGTEGRAHWLREAQAIARLNHPNVLSIYDAGEARSPDQNQQLPYIVMELAEGVTLRDYRPRSVAEMLAIGRQICAALSEAHAHHVIHGDLKPENVIVGHSQITKLMDFGLARLADVTTTAAVVNISSNNPSAPAQGVAAPERAVAEPIATPPGTIPYLAPEVLQGQPSTVQSDLFGLGVLLYELATGQLPFDRQDLIHIQPPRPPGDNNPQLPEAFAALIEQLLAPQAADRPQSAAAVQQALLQLEIALGEAPAPGDSPFMGMSYFDEIDANRFFGRELLTTRLVAQLREDRFLAVIIGASGSGKSSILRAGLMAALRQGVPLVDGTLPPSGSRDWRYVIITPTADPLGVLAGALTDKPQTAAALQNKMRSDPLALQRFTDDKVTEGQPDHPLTPSPPHPPTPSPPHPVNSQHLFIAVDQFEELFTLCHDETERRAFIDNLLTAAQSGSLTTVVIVLRADFYAHCAHYANLRQVVARRQEYIGPMSANELRRAIEEPARRNGWEFEPGLVDLILRDVGDEPGALPLLSHALLETWQRRRGRTLTLAGYAAAGGVQGAIAQSAEHTYQSLSVEEQLIVRRIFLRLTELGEGTAEGGLPSPDTRRRALLEEFIPRAEEAPLVETVVQKLVEARLIVLSKGTAEVAHEALIREWPALRQWLTDDREGLLLYRQLSDTAQGWETSGSDPGLLYRGVRLGQAQEWAAAHPDELHPLERTFLDASAALAAEGRAQEAERQRQAMQLEAERRAAARLRRLRNALGVALLLVAVAAFLSFNQFQEANSQREAAETARRSAEQNEALALLAQKEETAAREVAEDAQQEAEEERKIAESARAAAVDAQQQEQAVRQQVQALNSRLLVEELAANSAVALQTSPPQSLLLALEALAINEENDEESDAEGARSASAENQLRDSLAHTAGRALSGHDALVRAVAFSADGRWLATASDDGTARLWDISALLNEGLSDDLEVVPISLSGHEAVVRAVTFSPDSHWLVTVSEDNTGRLWDLSALNAEPVVLSGHNAGVNEALFSADGRWLVTVSEDTTGRLWDLETVDVGEEPIVLRGHEGPVWCVAFSPDGRWLVTGSADNTARLWNISTLLNTSLNNNLTANSVVFQGHEAPIRSVAFSPDGGLLATGSRDNTARLWDISTLLTVSLNGSPPPDFGRTPQTEAIVLSGHGHWIREVAFTADGSRLVTASRDGTVRSWDVGAVNDPVRFDAAQDSPEQSPGVKPDVLRGHDDWVRDITFSPDGRWLGTASWDGTVQLWDMDVGGDPEAESVVLRGHESGVNAIAFSPDGRLLASGGRDGTVRLWGMGHLGHPGRLWWSYDPWAEPAVLRDHVGWIYDMDFSPDGRWLATGGQDRIGRLWDLEDPLAEPIPLLGHEAGLLDLAFSPDGRWLATASGDNTARLWDIGDAPSGNLTSEPVILDDHEMPVTTVNFSPDGRWLVTGGDDAKTRLWDMEDLTADSEAAPLVLSSHRDAVLAAAFSPDGRWLATSSKDGTAHLWDISTLLSADLESLSPGVEPIILPGHADWANVVDFSPDSKWLVTASLDSTIRLWDVAANPIELSSVLLGHEGAIRSLAFSPDAHWMVTGADDSTTRLWNLNDLAAGSPTVAEPIVLRDQNNFVRAVAFSSDRRWLATGSQDGTARLWRLPLDELRETACTRAGRNFSREEWRLFFPDREYRLTCVQWSEYLGPPAPGE